MAKIPNPGVLLALGSAALFGATAPVSKLLLVSAQPQMLAGILYLGAGVGLFLLNVLRRRLGLPSVEAPLRNKELPWLAAVVIFGGIIGPVLLMLGLAQTSASTGSLLLNLETLATMIIAWVVFHESVDHRLLLGAVAILAGAALLSWTSGPVSFDAGALLVVGACVAWAIDNNLTRKLSSADPVQIAMFKGTVAGLFNIVVALGLGAELPSPGLVLAGAVLGLLGIGVSLVMFVLALRHLGAARTGAYYSLAPFIGAVLSIFALHDPVTPNLLVAAALMGVGVWLHLTERHDHMHVHAPLEHEHAHVHDEHHQHHHQGPVTEPHSHWHRHEPLRHRHPHYPDLHHRHRHS